MRHESTTATLIVSYRGMSAATAAELLPDMTIEDDTETLVITPATGE